MVLNVMCYFFLRHGVYIAEKHILAGYNSDKVVIVFNLK